jgi:hypothetical protein
MLYEWFASDNLRSNFFESKLLNHLQNTSFGARRLAPEDWSLMIRILIFFHSSRCYIGSVLREPLVPATGLKSVSN